MNESWLKRHALLAAVTILAPLTFAVYSWAEYGYFCDQSKDHDQTPCPSFWDKTHLHDWVYNATSNWQSDLLIGILLVVLLHKLEGPRGAEREDT